MESVGFERAGVQARVPARCGELVEETGELPQAVAVAALDLHKAFSWAAVLDADGEVLREGRVSHAERRCMTEFFASLPPGTVVVMEATFNWPWVADLAQALGLRPVLAHPLRAREMAKGLPKSDRRDAVWLGQLWLAGTIFPRSYLAPPAVRERRDRFRLRLFLVRMRTALKNNVHGQFFRAGVVIEEEVSDLFSKKGRAILAGLVLDEHERAMLERKLEALDDLGRHILALEGEILRDLAQEPGAEILMSLPGVGGLTAHSWLAEIGEPERFPNGRALASYGGVLPRENESAGKDFGRRTGGHCNRFLRWAALEAVSGAIRASPRMKSLYERVKAKNRKQPGKARVAVARELLELAHRLLTKKERYREIPPSRPGSKREREERRNEGSGKEPNSLEPRYPNRASPSWVSAGPERGQAD